MFMNILWKNCKVVLGYQDQVHRKTDCRCATNLSYHCEKFCTTNSIGCDYFKLKKKEKQFDKINNCGNQGSLYIRPHYFLNRF